MIDQEKAERAFMDSAARLIEAAVADAIRSDQEGVEYLAECLRVGGMISLRATIAPSTGIAQLAVEEIEPCGRTHQFLATELKRMAVQ
jgi:hypothetical protein